MMSLFGRGGGDDGFVLDRAVYDRMKSAKRLYSINKRLNPGLDRRIYTAFKTPESFLTDKPLDEKGGAEAGEASSSLTVSGPEAESLVLAKRSDCPLVIGARQTWLSKAAKEFGVETREL